MKKIFKLFLLAILLAGVGTGGQFRFILVRGREDRGDSAYRVGRKVG